jgi:hypothetical protein
MKNKIVCSLLAMLPIIASATNSPTVPSPYVSTQPGLEVSVRAKNPDGLFEVRADFSNPETREMFAASSAMVHAGEWATQTLPEVGPQPAVSFSATVDPSGKLAAYVVTLRRGGNLTGTSSGTVLVAP